MKKLKIVLIILLVCIFVLALGILIYLNVPRKIKIYEEYQQLYSKRETVGKAWGIIFDNDGISLIGENLEIEIPKIDFNKYYLLWSDGRRIKEINYTIVSKYKWWFNHPKGEALFDEKHYLHTIFIYKIEKVMVLRETP
ncbi:MAG: hypothetical protein MUF15_24290 [Acidobacteria bacterium]|jgi:hypothetical protein|nr:hypothetical protein [Acidobacteriota bacterium]